MGRMLPLALALITLAPLVSGANQAPEHQTLRDLPQRFFDAYASKDVDAFMALFSEKAPDYQTRKKTMMRLFAETGPIEVKSLVMVRVRQDGDTAQVRVRAELAGNDLKTGKLHPFLGRLDRVLDLMREGGGWKIVREGPSAQRLMERLVGAKTKAERLRLLDDDSDLVGSSFVLMVLQEGNSRSGRGKFDEAARLLDAAQEVAEPLGDADTLGLCYFYRGKSLKQQSRHEPALCSYQTALQRFREAHDRAWESSTLNDIGNVYYAMDRYKEALRQYQDSLKIKRDLKATTLNNIEIVFDETGLTGDMLRQYEKITRDLGDRTGEAGNLNNIGIVYEATGRYAEALQQYQESLKIKRDLGDRAGEARSLGNIGDIYYFTGSYKKALLQYQDSLKIARDLGDRKEEAVDLNGIGNVYDGMGRYGEALRQYQDSLKIAHDLGDRAGEVATLNNIGGVYHATGRYAEALRYYQDSLKIKRILGDRAGEALTLDNIGLVYIETKRYPEALQLHQDALKITRDLGERAGEARSLSNIGAVYEESGRYKEALRRYLDSVKIKRELGDRAGEAATLDSIGIVYKDAERYAEARQQFEAALGIAQSINALSIAFYCHRNLGVTYQAQGQWHEAFKSYSEAVRITELLRANTREPSLQSSLLAQKTGPFFLLAECQLELKQPDKAFGSGERMKARGLQDILQHGKADLRRGMSADERKQEQKLQDVLTALGVELENLRSKKADLDRQTALADELKKARQDYEAFRRELFLHQPDVATRRAEFAPASQGDFGAALFAGRPGLVVLSYLVGEKETLLFVLTASEKEGGAAQLTVHRLDVASKDLAEAVASFRDACSDPEKGEPVADDLYRWLIAPAADELVRAKRVVVIPDGVLHTLPFQAIKNPEGNYLIEGFAVSYAPSVTALMKMEELGARRRKEYAGKPASLLAVGVSDFGYREKPLPAAEKEARAVATAFGDGAKLLPGAEATLTKVEASWSGRRYLHFATHGCLNSDAPLYSSLVLSPGDGDEGVLYARVLVDAEIPAELAVMSACQTGLGRNVSGEGLLGLSWSWFAAGVPSTVASQWSVGDASTAKLMKVFYARLKASDSKAEALRQAELSLLKDDATRHPFYWAPFVLVGDDR